MIARLVGAGPEPVVTGDVIPWHAVARLKEGLIVVRDDAGRGS